MKEIIYQQNFDSAQLNSIRKNAEELGILFETAKLLYSRGLDTPSKIKRFLRPGKANFIDPFLIGGIREAKERIDNAKQAGELVMVYGDYDADGISATALLYKALKEYGVNVITAIPNREDGYGLNIDVIERAQGDELVDLIITVDCGISNVKEVEEIKDLGIDVIVTDHHEPPEILPDTLLINPKLDENIFGGYCGAGVAFKLATALLKENAYKYLDFAALATVADSMELIDENRDIVFEGLKLFSQGKVRPVFADLLSANNREVTAQTLAYQIAPRVNAAGRMGDAGSALTLFLSEDPKEIYEYSVKLNAYNLERQAECDKLYHLAKQKLSAKGAKRNVIMLYDEEWRTGFVGIVAARLAEEYSRPVIIFAGLDGNLKGSARSVAGINIFDAISSAKELLVEFGGHAQAAGVAIEKENFDEFERRIDEYLETHYDASVFIPQIVAEADITETFSMKFAKELELLEPYGVGNKKPLFTMTVGAVSAYPLKPNSPHITFKTPVIEMLKFSGVDQIELLDSPIDKTIVFEVNLSTFARQTYLKGQVKDILPVIKDDLSLRLISFEKALDITGCSLDTEFDELSADAINEMVLNKSDRYSTVYIASDPDTLKYYPPLKNTQRGIFNPTEKNLLDTVLFAPSQMALSGFERVVYLDKPLSVNAFDENQAVVVASDLYPYSNFDKVDLSRDAMIDAFVKIKALVGKKYVSSARLYIENEPDINPYQFIFALAVFMELDIFSGTGGVLKCDGRIKRELTSSQIYRQVESIKQRC